MAAATRTLLDEHGASADVIADSAEREIWKAHESSIWDHPGTVVKISVLPTDVESCLRLTAGSLSSSDWCAIGRAALGVLLVRLSDDERGRDVVARLRQHVVDKGGSLVVLRGDAAELRRRPVYKAIRPESGHGRGEGAFRSARRTPSVTRSD